jgi:hypothetical protein
MQIMYTVHKTNNYVPFLFYEQNPHADAHQRDRYEHLIQEAVTSTFPKPLANPKN